MFLQQYHTLDGITVAIGVPSLMFPPIPVLKLMLFCFDVIHTITDAIVCILIFLSLFTEPLCQIDYLRL
jgi:hypothetical protein